MKLCNSLFVPMVLVSLLLPASLAWSALEFHPYLTLGEEYNDNINLSASNEEEDWITTIEPGIHLTYDNRSVAATVDYALRYRLYKNNDQDNLDRFKDVQQANATALFFGGRPFTVRVSEMISRVALDTRDDNLYSDADRSTLYHLMVSPEYNWRLTPTFSMVFGYGYDRLDYVEPAGNDSEEHTGRVSLVKTLSADAEVFARYAYRVHQSNDEEDYDRQDYTLGLTYQLGARTTASVEGGYSTVEYDSGFDTDTTTWLVNLSYRLSEALTYSLTYSQDFTLTALDGLTETQEATLSAVYQKESLTASAGVFWNQSDYVRENRNDEAVGVRCDLSKPLARNLTAHLDAEYEAAQYDDVIIDEDVNRLTLGASLDYLYRRFLASLGYRYRINESDINTRDYTNNILTLSGTMRF